MPRKTKRPTVKLHLITVGHTDFAFKNQAEAIRFATLVAKAIPTESHWIYRKPEFQDHEDENQYKHLKEEDPPAIEIKFNVLIEKTEREPKLKGLPAPLRGLPAPTS